MNKELSLISHGQKNNVCHYIDGGVIMNRIKTIDIDLQTDKLDQ